MRRDQIWYTERRADGSTDLYPLSSFHPRNDEAIARNYGAGRYGALPVLPGQLRDLVPHGKDALRRAPQMGSPEEPEKNPSTRVHRLTEHLRNNYR